MAVAREIRPRVPDGAVFGGVVLYFSCLAVCIGATVSAAS